MANQTGIFITIKAWLPTGKGLDEQFTALSLVKTAHETGDYAPLLSAAKIEAVQTEQKTRRMEDGPATAQPTTPPTTEPDHNTRRDTFIIPEGHEAVRDENGKATGETRPITTPAAADPAIIETPVLDQADGKDEQPIAKTKLARSQQGLEVSKARNAAEDAGA